MPILNKVIYIQVIYNTYITFECESLQEHQQHEDSNRESKMEESKKCEEIPRCLQGKGQKELEESDNQKDSGHIKESERKYKVFCKSTQSEWQEVQQI